MPWTNALLVEKTTPSSGCVRKIVIGVSCCAEWWTLCNAQRNGILCIHLCTKYFVRSSKTKTNNVNEAMTTGVGTISPIFDTFQSSEIKKLNIAVAITSCVISSGEIKKVKTRFIKNTFMSAKDDFDNKTLLSKIFNNASRTENFRRNTSHKKAIKIALSKYPPKILFLGSTKLPQKFSSNS